MSGMIFRILMTGNEPEGWKSEHVTLQLRDGPKIVQCWRRRSFCIHLLQVDLPIAETLARVSHYPTGLSIGDFENVAAAIIGCDEIEPLRDDWFDLEKPIVGGWSKIMARMDEKFTRCCFIGDGSLPVWSLRAAA